MKPANHNRIELYVSSIALILFAFFLPASQLSAADDDQHWFDSDFEQQAEAVNEGELKLLLASPDTPTHQHINKIQISSNSLRDGWVKLAQCHHNLDAVPALQIVFAKDRIRAMKVESSDGVGHSSIVENTVQLEDISKGASLCLSAESRALRFEGNQVQLVNGPYMRRFLDGYYPMRVSLQVDFPSSELQYVSSSPVNFEQVGEGRLSLDLWFEGELRTRIKFVRKSVH